MKHLNGYDNIFGTEAWYFWGNMKVLLGHLIWDWALKARSVTQLAKRFWVCVLSAMFLSGQTFC